MDQVLHNPAFPDAADRKAALRLLESFAGLGAREAAFAITTAGASLLSCLGGNAPYLAGLALREPAALMATLAQGPEAVVDACLAALDGLDPAASGREIRASLRRAKRQAALAIAIADLGGLWALPQITAALSALAEAALRAALRHLLRGLHQARRITLIDPLKPEQDCGLVALALGKLGARELNYSSDIDIVLLFDPANPVMPEEGQALMARLAHELVSLLSAHDENGYVFRVDLRLRPDPSATPPVVSLQAALLYYESQGRTWERAAFSKARPVAGDLTLGTQFLIAIKPFIWRRNLDFAAIDDIRGMKRQIDAGQNAEPGLRGLDVKLGRGGIREIEFIVQTLSLVWGGQDHGLRIPATLEALPALAKAGHLPLRVARDLAADYAELRRVEHRLQMVDDRQTHQLPVTDEALRAFAVFLGAPQFLRSFPRLLARVHKHFLAFFDAETTDATAPEPGTHGAIPADFTAHLLALGFKDTRHAAERLRAWASGQTPALRSERARGLLTKLTPPLLKALSTQPDPDRAFALFDTMLTRQRAGVPLLSLFYRNPALLKRLAAVLGAAPALAEHLASDAHALDALLAPRARFAAPKPALRALLGEAADLEQAVTIIRRFVRREEFHLSVATLEGRMDIDEAGRLRTNLAAAALSLLLPRVMAAHVERYGKVRGASLAIVALGKAGSGEMLAGSDLDLMFIHAHAPAANPPTPYFVRLAHALTAALTAQGAEGPLYHVDMRLRPSGNQGPVAVSLPAFQRYHEAESWTWERLALTRARVLAATPGFAPRVNAAILRALRREAAPAIIRRDTQAMRARLAADKPPRGPFDIKYLPGGMLELGFIVEALMLIHGQDNPDLFHPNSAVALRALNAAGHLATPDCYAMLQAGFLWRTLQGINRITGLSDRAASAGPSMLAPLLQAADLANEAALQAAMAKASQNVRDCFQKYIITGAAL